MKHSVSRLPDFYLAILDRLKERRCLPVTGCITLAKINLYE
ncbi:hypothetical protein [Niabella aquatica]